MNLILIFYSSMARSNVSNVQILYIYMYASQAIIIYIQDSR